IDRYIAPVNSQSEVIKNRILRENGIVTRHYGIDAQGNAINSTTGMAVDAIKNCLYTSNTTLNEITLLTSATSGGDVLMPGFGNMVQGQLHAPPMETRSHHGICASGIAALKDAANLVDNGSHQNALVCASEFPSRLFKSTRYEPMGYDLSFNAHFLRWMLSDGAGAMLLSNTFNPVNGISLKIDWIHTKSFSGDYPLCMQMGKQDNNDEHGFMDHPSFSAAEAKGSMVLQQDYRMLPQLFEVGIHELAELEASGWLNSGEIDHFLFHYSSERLGKICGELMQRAHLKFSEEKWYSNLKTRGNTGAASIFIMLSDFLKEKKLNPGEKIFCLIPESGRFTLSFVQLTVVDEKTAQDQSRYTLQKQETIGDELPAPPHLPQENQSENMKRLLQSLASIWHNYRSAIWRTPLVRKIVDQQFTQADYLSWTSCWIPQVREGSKWMRNAAEHLSEKNRPLKDLISMHAGEEQNDFQILFEDYLLAGGTVNEIDELKRNPGGEALNAYMYSLSSQTDAFGLLGGIYIIEGTGQRIVPALLPLIKGQVDLPENCFKFLDYHGENDVNHLNRWLMAVEMVLKSVDEKDQGLIVDEIIATASQVAKLYQIQWERV
ncbi:MAG: 3-oxoacyl-ACP synthase, partial [Gammaproteobacteria bacterium]|nr:3-oxoacyl-ACP synthase [Gammaproteobacteria bacterium]